MTRQVVRAVRDAMTVEVLGGSRKNAPGFGQPANGDIRVRLELSCPNGDVNAVLDQVVVPVGRDDIDGDVRVTSGELRQEWCDVQDAERQGGANAKHTHRVLNCPRNDGFSFPQLVQSQLAA